MSDRASEPAASLEHRIGEARRRWAAAPSSRSFLPLADLLRQVGRHDEALALLEAGLSRHPRSLGALVTLARSLAAVGRTAQAAEAAGRILELDPDNLVALEMLGEEERRRGDLLAAIGHYERLAHLEPTDRHWSTELGRLRDQRWAGAQDGDSDGDVGFATLTLVDLYLAQGYRQKAEAVLRRLAVERPDDESVRGRLAALGEPEDTAPAGPSDVPASMPRLGPDAGGRREQSKEQFAMWIERLRSDRGANP